MFCIDFDTVDQVVQLVTFRAVLRALAARLAYSFHRFKCIKERIPFRESPKRITMRAMGAKINVRLSNELRTALEEKANGSGETLTAVLIDALKRGMRPAPAPAIQSREVLKRVGILPPVSTLEATLKPFCPRCGSELRPRADDTETRCRLCGRMVRV